MAIGITGGKGFIGTRLTRHVLASQAGTVRVLARNANSYEAPLGAQLFPGDLLSSSDCVSFVQDLSLIYYLAHNNSPVNSDRDLPADVLVNLVPFLNLLQAVQTAGARPHIVYFSSGGAVYAPRAERLPYLETDRCAPSTSYGIQKLAAEDYLRVAAAKGYLTATVLRVGNAYGAPLSETRRQGLIGVAVSCVGQGKPVRIFGSLDNVRDYIHLDDICDIAVRASIPKEPFSVINVGSGAGYSVREVLQLMEELWGKPLHIQCEQTLGNWLTDWVVLDSSKARQEFGWSPAIDLRAGIARLLGSISDSSSAGSRNAAAR